MKFSPRSAFGRHGIAVAFAVASFAGLTASLFAARAPLRLLIVSTPLGEGRASVIAADLLPRAVRNVVFTTLSEAGDLRERPHPDAADGGVGEDAGETAAPAPDVAEQAREAALAFDLVRAAELWRRAADTLLSSDAILQDSEQVADTLIEAGAASTDAGERDLALLYFRRAIAVQSGVVPGPSISPDAKALFQEATQRGPALLDIPRDPVLEDICRTAGTDGLIWVAAARDGDEWSVSFKLFLAGDAASEMEVRRHGAQSLAKAKIAAERGRFEGMVTRKIFGKDILNSPKVSISDGILERTKPWYRKWWVYTLGGALLVGGVVGVTTYLVLQPKESTLTVNF